MPKGVYPHKKPSEESRRKMSLAKKGISQNHSGVFKKGHKSYPKEDKKNPFYGKKHTAETKLKISLSGKGRVAWNKGLVGYKSGKDHYDWKGGKSKNRKSVKKEWVELAKKIYKRDSYTCYICGNNGGNLNAHHKKHWGTNPELAFDEDNLITLCVKCHTKLHTLERFYRRNHAYKNFERLASELKRKIGLI